MKRQFRQGDVLLVAAKIPEGTKLSRKQRVVLAEGEVTGHAHVLTAPTETETEVFTDVDAEFIRIMAGNGLLVHEEHESIELPPGEYRRVQQREYGPQEIRRVAD